MRRPIRHRASAANPLWRRLDRAAGTLNPFLAAVVRIQTERGQRVISTGPYATVRHPLYAAVLIYLPANALLLGSWYGLAVSFVLSIGIVFRTAMEDRELQRGLEGYAEYAARVRYRLIPLVW